MIKVGSQFSGVGAFEQSLKRLGIKYDNIYAADIDKYARQTYLLNFEEPKYYVKDVYDTPVDEITNKYGSLDLAMFSPPCQSFSLAGKRKGEDSKNGVLFYNSHEFIKKNMPRYFIFENVKGLLSDDNGKTFQRWIDYLGGKSANGNPVIFPHEESVPYHVYYQVLNAKHYGVPQNRERIFIIGIRNDKDNEFSFPKPFPLTKRLKDVLEPEVDEKYFLSDKMVNVLAHHQNKIIKNETPEESGCIHAGYFKMGGRDQQYIKDELTQVGSLYENNSDAGRVYDTNSVSCTLKSDGGGGGAKTGLYLVDTKQKANFGNKRLNETLNNNEVPEQDCIIDSYNKSFHTEVSPSILTTVSSANMHHVKIGAIRGRNPENPKSRETGLETEQMLEINENGTSNALTTVQKDNVVVIPANNSKGYDIAEEEEDSINFSVPSSETRRGRVGHGVSQTLDTACNQGIYTKQRIRRLTPRECMNLMNFNEDFIEKTINSNLISDSQLYRQCGNSIVVNVLCEIIKKLKLK